MGSLGENTKQKDGGKKKNWKEKGTQSAELLIELFHRIVININYSGKSFAAEKKKELQSTSIKTRVAETEEGG